MRPISKKMRLEISTDPFFRQCVITGDTKNVSIEHCWIYGGKQINEIWAMVPLRRDLNVNMEADVKEKCRWISINRAAPADFAKYPKFNWEQTKRYLNGKYSPKIIKPGQGKLI